LSTTSPISRFRSSTSAPPAASAITAFTPPLVGSTDVTTHVVRRLAVESEHEDFAHADLLSADEAAELAWAPLNSST
jgi:hypothetical protein